MQAGPPPADIKEAPKPKVRPKAPPPRYRSLQEDIGQLLVTANIFAAPFAPHDILDDVEILALAKAIDDQAKRSPRFRRYVVRALETAGGTGLFAIVVMIAGRRAARHGLMAREWDLRLKAFLQVSTMDKADVSDPEAMAAMAAAMTAGPDVEPSTNGESAS